MANINSRNISEAEEELRLAYSDLVAFGKLFLPDDFQRSESPFFHYEVCDAPNVVLCMIFVLQMNPYFMVGLLHLVKYPFLILIILNTIWNTMIELSIILGT